jgi:hypothetical protein
MAAPKRKTKTGEKLMRVLKLLLTITVFALLAGCSGVSSSNNSNNNNSGGVATNISGQWNFTVPIPAGSGNQTVTFSADLTSNAPCAFTVDGDTESFTNSAGGADLCAAADTSNYLNAESYGSLSVTNGQTGSTGTTTCYAPPSYNGPGDPVGPCMYSWAGNPYAIAWGTTPLPTVPAGASQSVALAIWFDNVGGYVTNLDPVESSANIAYGLTCLFSGTGTFENGQLTATLTATTLQRPNNPDADLTCAGTQITVTGSQVGSSSSAARQVGE